MGTIDLVTFDTVEKIMVEMGAMTIPEVRIAERLSNIDAPTTAPDSGEVFSNAGL